MNSSMRKLFVVFLSLVILLACIPLASTNVLAAGADPAKDLVGYWNFDEGNGTVAVDSSKNGNTAVMAKNTQAMRWDAGKFSSGLTFDGITNGYIEITSSNALQLSGKTVAFWYKVNEKKTYNMIYGMEDATDSYSAFSKDGNMRVCWTDESGKSAGTTAFTAPFEDGWAFYAVVYDSNEKTVCVYKNGNKVRMENPNSVNSSSFPCTGGISSGPVRYIGARNTYGANLLSGSLDDFRVYNGPLSPEEIMTLYQQDLEPPSMPYNLTATAMSYNQVELAWSASTDNTGVSGYDVYRNGVFIGSSVSTSYSDRGVSPDTQYIYTVRSSDAFGNKSALSNEALAATPGKDPSVLLDMRFENSLEDSSGINPPGVWSNTNGSYSAGHLGLAANVTSVNIKVRHNPVFDNLNKLTLKVWAKNNDVFSTPSNNYLIRKAGVFSLRGGVSGANGFIKFTLRIGGIDYELSNWQVLKSAELTRWHLYTASFDGGHMRIYMDGNQVGERELTGVIDSSASEVLVGEFDGLLDNVLILQDSADTDPPAFYDCNPQPGQTWVDENSALTVSIRDKGKGTDFSSIRMAVNGSTVLPKISGTTTDCTLTWIPSVPFAYGQRVPVSLSAADNEGNTTQTAYEFTVKGITDTIPPIASLYAYRNSPSTVAVYSTLSDNESGTVPGALMQFSTDSVNWSPPEAYSNSKNLNADESVSCIFARFSDNAGNWTEPLSFTLDGANDQLVALKGNPGVQLYWKPQPGAIQYKVLRSTKLGWKGSMTLSRNLVAGETNIPVDNTAGLRAGDQIHFGTTADDYYVKSIIDLKTFEIDHALLRDASVSYSPRISGGWVFDYSDYTELAAVSGNEFTDTTAEAGKDYYYIVACTNGTNSSGYLHPAAIRLTDKAALYDAALGSNGGYAWKAGQSYSDTPELIDGDANTAHIRMQYEDPALRSRLSLGFHRFYFNQAVSLQMLELSQNSSLNRVQANSIRIGFDDNSSFIVDLEKDPSVTRKSEGAYRTYTIPLSKKSKYAEIYLSSPTGQTGYTEWNKVSFYTGEICQNPVTSATQVDKVTAGINFSKPNGTLPTLFGTDEIFDNTEGLELGWMINGWQKAKEIFNLYRIQTGDVWPRAYGTDVVKIGKLAQDTSVSATTLTLAETDPEASFYLSSGQRVRIGDELMRAASSLNNGSINVVRGYEYTLASQYPAGTPVYAYKSAGQIMRLQEAIPEFKVEKYTNAYVSGITRIGSESDPASPDYADINDPRRTAELDIILRKGEFKVGDVIRIGRECFLVLTVNNVSPAKIELHVRRGYDGTNDRYIQHNYGVPDVYKLLNYEPYYEGFKNDPAKSENYNWDNLKYTLDKIIKEGGAIPWFISYSTEYATQHRGRVASLESINGGSSNVIVDEYNSTHDDTDWWYQISSSNREDNDAMIRGNMYQYYHAYLKILTGDAAGKVFYIRSHTGDRLRVVKTWNDSTYNVEKPQYADLAAEGLKPGDAYMVVHSSSYGNVAPKYWQYNADIFYNIAKYVRENYTESLGNKPIYFEYYIEPNLGAYGTWTKDSYIDSYKIFANTLRTGGPHFDSGFSKDKVLIGAGSIAGGLNPGVPIPGTEGDYDFALSILERSPIIDFISHHRYYVGSRIQKRENSWEYYMLKMYAKSLGKDIMIVDSEDSVATAGGTGQEEARHWAKFSVPYWMSNFINSYQGDYGESGRLDFIIHFRNYYANDTGLGMFASDREGRTVADLVYWTIKLFQANTSKNSNMPDSIVETNYVSDQYGWVEVMGTVHGETGAKKVHLVNKKGTSLVVDLNLAGIDDTNGAVMDSIIGGGSNQSIQDGYHPLDMTGAVIRTKITDIHKIVLEPYSTNIISLD